MSMTPPAISVIVPVYKAEAYLHRCVDSLLAQTFGDFELLLIDDGSPDRSGEICDGYAVTDSRVRVFHKQNGGVSSARQFGIDHARGEYVIHADPDDWTEPTMLEALYAKATGEEPKADMVICDFYVNSPGRQSYKKQQPSAMDRATVGRELFQQLHGSCCNKLVKRVCYSGNGVKFPENISCCEDLVFNCRLLPYINKVCYLPQAFYHYEQAGNAHSIVHTYSMKRYEEDLHLLQLIGELPLEEDTLRIAVESVALGIAWRALASRLFTAREFRRRFRRYRHAALRSRQAKHRLLLYPACLGLQDIVHPLIRLSGKSM